MRVTDGMRDAAMLAATTKSSSAVFSEARLASTGIRVSTAADDPVAFARIANADERVGLVDGWPEDGVVGMWLQGLSADFVHTPCFHNHALPNGEGGRYMLHAPCTPSSLLVHYMTPALWERIDARTGLLECGTAVEAQPICGALHAAGYARLEPPLRLESK